MDVFIFVYLDYYFLLQFLKCDIRVAAWCRGCGVAQPYWDRFLTFAPFLHIHSSSSSSSSFSHHPFPIWWLSIMASGAKKREEDLKKSGFLLSIIALKKTEECWAGKRHIFQVYAIQLSVEVSIANWIVYHHHHLGCHFNEKLLQGWHFNDFTVVSKCPKILKALPKEDKKQTNNVCHCKSDKLKLKSVFKYAFIVDACWSFLM